MKPLFPLLIAASLSLQLTAFAHEIPTSENASATSDTQAESKLLSNIRQLILSGKRSGEGYFGASGNQLIFQSEREVGNPFFQMYVLDLESGDTTRVSAGQGKTTCGWIHPGGQSVMFSATHEDPQSLTQQKAELEMRASGKQRRYSWDYDPQYEIYRRDLKSQQLTNLTKQLGYDAEGAYSPDGKQIVFASNRQAYGRKLNDKDSQKLQIDPAYFMDLYIMNADGSNVRQLTTVPGYDGGPFFSPDGKGIVFRRFNEEGDKAEIWTMKTDGSQQKQITSLGVMSWAPFYHPSGDYLIFATNRHGFGNFELYMVDSQGQKEPVRVTYREGFDGLPALSPDGKRLVWTSNRSSDGASQLFWSDWNDAAARQLLSLAPLRQSSTDALAVAKTQSAITAQDIQAHVQYLASDKLEGRLTGSTGEKLATDYASAMFKQYGLAPAGDQGAYLQGFQFVAGVQLGQANTLKANGKDLMLNQDWVPLTLSASTQIDPAEVVFAGYGLKAPANGSFAGYDSYTHLDVKDKWVMVLRYWPENVDAPTQQELKRYSNLPYKAMLAREMGAKGLIVISGPNTPSKHSLIPFEGQGTATTASMPMISLTNHMAQNWFQQQGQDLKAIQDKLDKGDFVQGLPFRDLKLQGQIDIKKTEGRGHNVLGLLKVPGATQTVVVGAHMDHLGKGHSSSSLANSSQIEAGKLIHYGADDNASGSAGVLEIAEALSSGDKGALKQNVLFALWSGEEMGLLGSNHFVSQYTEAAFKQQFSAYLNMDMVGRMDKALVLQGTGSSPVWNGLIEKYNLSIGLPITLQQSAYLPTDATSFYVKGIPALSAFTGAHTDYHTPGDTADKLNYPATARIVELLKRLTLGIASNSQAPEYTRQDPPKETQSRGLRVYLGTIPDYAGGDVKGLRISGVSNGGPADKAGLKGGDVIVELGGKTIENIYDYTYALDTLSIGKETTITVLREGQKLVLKITPGSRN